MKRGDLVAMGILGLGGAWWIVGCGSGQEGGSATSARAQQDGRTAVVVPAAARTAVLREMRQMLAALGGVLTAMAGEDPAAVAEAARSGGMAIAVDTDPAVEASLPAEFVRLGTATHRGFDAVAAAAEAGMPPDTILARLGRLTGDCVACHETYRLEVETAGDE